MTRSARLVVFTAGGLSLLVLFTLAAFRLPGFGSAVHSYRDMAVTAALARQTPNAVAGVNFDQRALDTLGEEIILLASVLGAAALLRPGEDERPRHPPDPPKPLQAIRFGGYLMLPVTLVLGLDVVAHGHLTPGGGFQGGVVLATGLHLLYVAGSYPALRRLRPLSWYELGEAVGGGVFGVTGVLGVFAAGGFLANFLPLGRLGALASAGTVPLLNFAVSVAVASGVVVLLAQFLEADVLEGTVAGGTVAGGAR
jgi:multicomponent Na+:H+ antiporter subunit B